MENLLKSLKNETLAMVVLMLANLRNLNQNQVEFELLKAIKQPAAKTFKEAVAKYERVFATQAKARKVTVDDYCKMVVNTPGYQNYVTLVNLLDALPKGKGKTEITLQSMDVIAAVVGEQSPTGKK